MFWVGGAVGQSLQLLAVVIQPYKTALYPDRAAYMIFIASLLSMFKIPEQSMNGNYPAAAIRFAMSPIVSGLMWMYLDVVLLFL